MRLTSGRIRRRERFDPRSLTLALSRTILAVAQIVGIVLTSTGDLIAPETHDPSGVRCTGLRKLSLWCVAGPSSAGLRFEEFVAVAVLLGVAAGYRPRWTCVPHWYVTTSFGMSATEPWGGDSVASIATLLLIPILLGDDRQWQWVCPTTEMRPWWQGAAYAAWSLMRIQVAVIYADAALSKLLVSQWRNGTAMYTIFTDPYTGMPYRLRRLVTPILNQDLIMRPLTLSIPALELAIAFCVLSSQILRKKAVQIAVLLHVGIAALMGLVVFAAVMVSVVLLCMIDGDSSLSTANLQPVDTVPELKRQTRKLKRRQDDSPDTAVEPVRGRSRVAAKISSTDFDRLGARGSRRSAL